MSENHWRFSREVTLGDLTMAAVYLLTVAVFITRLDGKVEAVKTEQEKESVRSEEIMHGQIELMRDVTELKTKLDERTVQGHSKP